MSKQDIRKEFLLKRKQFSNTADSKDICKTAITLTQFINAKTVMLYLASNYEVDTAYLIAYAQKTGKTVCAPRVLNETEMEAAIIDASGFQKGSFNIWEPKGKSISKIDIVFVPGVAFDKKGNRLGYGKGYYDRFLMDKESFTVGLAFSCQIADELPADTHDYCLDMILTENEVYK